MKIGLKTLSSIRLVVASADKHSKAKAWIVSRVCSEQSEKSHLNPCKVQVVCELVPHQARNHQGRQDSMVLGQIMYPHDYSNSARRIE